MVVGGSAPFFLSSHLPTALALAGGKHSVEETVELFGWSNPPSPRRIYSLVPSGKWRDKGTGGHES